MKKLSNRKKSLEIVRKFSLFSQIPTVYILVRMPLLAKSVLVYFTGPQLPVCVTEHSCGRIQ